MNNPGKPNGSAGLAPPVTQMENPDPPPQDFPPLADVEIDEKATRPAS